MTQAVVLVKVTIWFGEVPLTEQPPLAPKVTGSPADEVAVGVYVELSAGELGALDVNVTVGVAGVKVCADGADVAVPCVESAAIVAVTLQIPVEVAVSVVPLMEHPVAELPLATA
jgi:hypothetical protein